MPEKTIVVTGFGPFVGHQINASWEAVNLLPNVFPFQKDSYVLQKHMVDVTYEAVDRIIPLIWASKPDLVVHVGVNGGINAINLEIGSYSSGYCKPDFANRCLPCDKITLHGKTGSENGSTMLKTNLNVNRMAQELNLETKVQFCCSEEVGNYLCGYIYLKSLDQDPDRTLFIHVPKIDAPYTSEETMASVYNVIGKCLEQLSAEKKLS